MGGWLRGLLVVVLLGGTGCGTVLSTFTPARGTPHKHVRLGVAVSGNLPVGPIVDVLDSAEVVGDRVRAGEMVSEQEIDELWQAAAGLALNPPSVVPELHFRYGLHDVVDLGLRLSTGAFRLDGRWTFLVPEDGSIGGSVGLGLGYYALSFNVPGFLDGILEIEDFRRFEADIPLLFGWSGDIGHFWFGPKLVLTGYSTSATLDLGTETRLGDVSGGNVFFVGQIGGAIGYRYVWFAIELTIGGMSGSADIETIAGNVDASFGGLVIYPTIGLLGQF